MIERSGERVAIRSWGRSNFDRDIPHSADTRYAAESISKMFTHAAVLALAANGKLSLTDKLARFIPDFPSASQISVRQLIDHEAGISRDLDLGDEVLKPHSTADLVSLIAKTKNGSPGKSAYSNNGYRILARVIELAGKGPFDDLVREFVFEPRNMRDTVFGGFGDLPNAATGYVPAPGWGTIAAVAPWNFANSRGAASYFTTPNDLMRFLPSLPLEPTDMVTPKSSGRQEAPARYAGHDGFGDGFGNLAYTFPDHGVRLVVMSNIQSGLFMPMHDDLRRMALGGTARPPAIERPSVSPPNERWKDFVGQYDLFGEPLTIRRVDDRLEVRSAEAFHPLIAIGPDRFFMRLRYATMTFEGPAGRPATLLRWAEGGGEFPLKRMS